MNRQQRINHISKKFPVLAGHTDMINLILDIRKAFNAENVPFEIVVNGVNIGDIDKYLNNVSKSPCLCGCCQNKKQK